MTMPKPRMTRESCQTIQVLRANFQTLSWCWAFTLSVRNRSALDSNASSDCACISTGQRPFRPMPSWRHNLRDWSAAISHRDTVTVKVVLGYLNGGIEVHGRLKPLGSQKRSVTNAICHAWPSLDQGEANNLQKKFKLSLLLCPQQPWAFVQPQLACWLRHPLPVVLSSPTKGLLAQQTYFRNYLTVMTVFLPKGHIRFRF